MGLSISTPPNTIAFSTGTVETKEMAKAGTLVSLIGIMVLMALAILLFNVEGVS